MKLRTILSRICSTIAVLLGIALFGLTLTSWVRSYRSFDVFTTGWPWPFLISVLPGSIHLDVHYDHPTTSGPWGDWHLILRPLPPGVSHDPAEVSRLLTHFSVKWQPTPPPRGKMAGYDATVMFRLEFPHWFLLTLVLVAFGGWWWWLRGRRAALRKHRIRAGECGQCGYDMRGTPERCPECGTQDTGSIVTDGVGGGNA